MFLLFLNTDWAQCRLGLNALNAPLLGRAAAVVRNRRNVRNARDLQAAAIEGPYRRLTPRAGTCHANLDVLDAVLLRRGACLLGGDLSRKRRALARTAETAATRGRPGERIALPIG